MKLNHETIDRDKGYKGAAVLTQENQWRTLGVKRRERLAKMLEIGSKKAIANCKKLYFYPAGRNANAIVFQARMYFLAGLLNADTMKGRMNQHKRLLQLEDMARDKGYEIININPSNRRPLN